MRTGDGMADARGEARGKLTALLSAPEATLGAVAGDAIAQDAVFDLSCPLDRLEGREAFIDEFVRPLRAAMPHVRRRDEIFIGGDNRRSEGGWWTASVTHYVGAHAAPLFGALPSGRLAYFRSGEFYEFADGKIVRGRIIFDLPDLMRQAGRSPFPNDLGAEILFPSPETHDGICPPPTPGEDSLTIVERMFAGLHAYDPKTYASVGQVGTDGTWDSDLMWYGPGGIGSSTRWEGFVTDHRQPFLDAFPDRKGGNHYCRISDGAYCAVSGWPSMTMTHRAPYLGMPTTGKALTLRVMDFYRCAGGRIMENWVLLDLGDLTRQMGGDIFESQREAGTIAAVR
ncbi:MAG: ester cyclase [Pseudomonadota bacterium]